MSKTIKPKKKCCKDKPRCKRCPVVCKRLEKQGLARRTSKGSFVLIDVTKKDLAAARVR